DEIEPIILASRRNYLFVGESIDPDDWQPGITTQQIYNRVIKGVHQGNGHIILMHDAGGVTRKHTLQALPLIIRELKKEGYHFISIEQYLGKSRDQLMPPIKKGNTYYAMQSNLALATLIYEIGDFITALLIIFLVLGLIRLVVMYILMIREKRIEHHRIYPEIDPHTAPLVSIIVPAYNEEVNITATLSNLRKQDYPNFNVVFVDDGSKDNTLQCVQDHFGDDHKIQILHQKNAGKASALNNGINHTDAEYIVCIDADTRLQHDAIGIMMKHMLADTDKKVGAVAGNVKTGNERNILTKWQSIEYTTSQNFDRMAYSSVNAITVVPGAIGCFRRQAIIDAGGLTTDTLAEDCDLTMRILDAGYIIENENKAVALTEAPETIRQFVKQRTRWCFGVLQSFWKHRSELFTTKHKGLGLWALPNMLVFQYIIPTFSPIADLLMIIGLFTGNFWQIFSYYLLFLLIDGSVSFMAFMFEHERLSKLFWIIPQRFFYRWIMYFVLFKTYLKAIKGELQSWGVLKRTGDVQIE
ncbi:MAG: glycosyltransferase, partial [Prevotella sp.]|nr:glycosyltransferase [Prevotella sp.]